MSHLQDCYYFFLSSCNRKPCQFRHCEQALGSEVVCELWRVGRCSDLNCTFRHMVSNKDRSGTPCWFETQPQGCRKPHCVFQHSKPRQNVALENLPNDLILPTTDSCPTTNNHTVESKSSEINISIDDDESDDPENHVEEKQKLPIETKPSEEQEKLEKILNFSPNDDLFNSSQKPNDQTDEDEAPWENESIVKQSDNRKGVQLGHFRSNAKPGLLSPQDGKIDCTFAVKSIDQIRKEREASDKSNSDKVKSSSQKRELEMEQDSDNKLSISRPVKIRRNRCSIPSTADQPNADVSESKSSPQLSPTHASTPLREIEKDNDSPTEELDFDFDKELSTCLSTTDNAKNDHIEVDLEDDDLMLEINQLLSN